MTTSRSVDRERREIREAIINDHCERPRNYGTLRGATHTSEAFNPLCGDRYTIFLRMVDDVVAEAGFEGRGCAISMASASIMTKRVWGLSRTEALALTTETAEFLSSGLLAHPDEAGDLLVFEGIHRIPTRRRCAMLAWTALREALTQDQRPVGPAL